MKRAYKIQEFVAHTGNVNCVKIGKKTSRVLVTGGEDTKVNMWAVGKPNPILSLSGHSSAVESVTFDVSEVLVVAGSASGTVKLWDLEEARIVRTLTGHRSNCTALDFHPFGEFFASGSLDTNLKVWDVRRRGCIHTYKGHTKCVKCVRFSPDGRWVVSGGEDNVVKLWDLTAGKLMHEFKHHDSQVECLDFHPQEFLLATGSADRTVKFVDLETFASIGCAGPETTGVRSLVFHPDGQTLLYGLHESLKVYSWEPLRCHDVVEVGWSKLADLSISEGKLLGCSYNQSCVGVWVVDLAHVAPHGTGVARGFGSPRSSFSFRSPKLITSRDLQQVGDGLTRLSMDKDQGAESTKETSVKVSTGRDSLARHGSEGMTRLNSARDPRFQQPGDAGTRSSSIRDQAVDPLTEVNSKPATSRELSAHQAKELGCKTKDQLTYQVNDEGTKLNSSRDFPVQQVRNGVDKLITSRDSAMQLDDRGDSLESSREFVSKQDCDEREQSKDESVHRGDDEGSHGKGKDHPPPLQVSQDSRKRLSSLKDLSMIRVNGGGQANDVTHHGNGESHNLASRRDPLGEQTADNGGKVAVTREHLFPEAVTRANSSRDHLVQQATDAGSKVTTIREQLFPEAGSRLNSNRDHPSDSGGSKVTSIREQLFPDAGSRSNSNRDNPIQQASDCGSKVTNIKEILFPDAGTRLNSNRDHPGQLAHDGGNRVNNIKEQLFPESGSRLNISREHPIQQSNDGASRVMSIREQLFPESGNRLNNRDIVPRHMSTSEARKPVDIVVKRPIAFEVMNTSPRILQMDPVKPATPTRGIIKVEDHSFLIGSARSATKSNAFQNGQKGFGLDADTFVAKGSRLERSNSFHENGPKPLGLDMNAFAPKGSLSDRGDAVGSDIDLIKELMQQHQTVSNILLARLTNMQVVHQFLARDDLKGAVEALGKVSDPSVLIDMVNVLMGKCDSFTIEICSMLLPSINQLLNSDYEKYLLTGIALLTMLVKNFGPMIHSTRAAPRGVGVDLEQERRLECSNVCYEKLLTVKQSLVPLTRRGGQLAKAAHDLSLTLDEI